MSIVIRQVKRDLQGTLPVSFGLTYPGYGELKHVEVEGVWQTVFCTFLVYAMLPLRSVVSDYFIRILLKDY